MPRGGPRPGSGRLRKVPLPLLTDPTAFKTALEWSMAALNDPTVAVETKAKIAAAVLPYQSQPLESVAAPTKKDRQADLANEAAKIDVFARQLAPPSRFDA